MVPRCGHFSSSPDVMNVVEKKKTGSTPRRNPLKCFGGPGFEASPTLILLNPYRPQHHRIDC